MKKLRFLLIIIPVFTLGIIVFEGCKKDSLNKTEYEENDPYAHFKPLYATLRQIISSSRSEESDIFERLTDHTEGLDSLLEERDFFHFLLDSLITENEDMIKFTNVLRAYSDYRDSTYFSQSLLNSIDNDTNLSYGNYDYFPMINITNFSCMDTSKSPIFAVGIDLDGVDDSLSDHIPGWYYDSFRTKHEIALDEDDATGSDEPILVLINDIIVDTSSNRIDEVKDYYADISDFLTDMNHKNINSDYPYIDYYRIAYRYECSSRSDYALSYCWFTGSSYQWLARRDMIKRIHKRDIPSTIFYNDKELYSFGVAWYYVTFEYDFWASKKPIWVDGRIGGQWVFCRMSYLEDYYQKCFFFFADSGGQTIPEKGVCRFNINP